MSRFIRFGRLEDETRFGITAYWMPDRFLALEMIGLDFGLFYVVIGDVK